MVVQQYIDRPLTVNGFKMDMRLYVLVTSFKPLVVYMYREGIARFGTSPYNLGNIDDLYCHLTNTSINKHNPKIEELRKKAGAGCKWTLAQLREYFRSQDIEDRPVWRRISTLVIYTLLCLNGVFLAWHVALQLAWLNVCCSCFDALCRLNRRHLVLSCMGLMCCWMPI
eukprot:m.201989 g.201989  ORF g.201989 m.201989 type:complete len:169 (-) comp16872_c0_seq3:808-1314(-)